jgi:hypothetical protein
MAAAPFECDLETVGSSHHRAGPHGKRANRQARHVVQAIDLLHAEALHHAVLDHLTPAAAAFFGRLEDQDGRSVEVAGLGQVAGCAQQHGCVSVMAAGMHLARHGGAIGQVGLLLDGQGIHVGPQANNLAGTLTLALDDGHHAGLADAGHDLVAAERLQLLGHDLRGAVNIEQQFGIAMKIAAPFSDLA